MSENKSYTIYERNFSGEKFLKLYLNKQKKRGLKVQEGGREEKKERERKSEMYLNVIRDVNQR